MVEWESKNKGDDVILCLAAGFSYGRMDGRIAFAEYMHAYIVGLRVALPFFFQFRRIYNNLISLSTE